MGAFDVKEDDIITIHGPKWDAHEQVLARTTVLVADEEWVTNQLMKIKSDFEGKGNRAFRRSKQASMSLESQIGAANRLWVFRMLKSWTFTKDGQPMPLSLESVKMLRQDYLDYIYEQIMKAQPKDEDEETEEDDEEEGTPFTASASHSIADEISDDYPVKKKPSRNFLTNF